LLQIWLEIGQVTTAWRVGFLETPYGETTRSRIWRFRSDATKMGLRPDRSIRFPPQDYHSQSIGSALRSSTFTSFDAFARKQNPNVGSALWASPFERRKCTEIVGIPWRPPRSRWARLRPRWLFRSVAVLTPSYGSSP